MQVFEYIAAIIATAVTMYAFLAVRQIATTGSDSIRGLKLLTCKTVIALSIAELASYLYAININSNFKHILSTSILLTESTLALTITLLLKRNASLLQSLKENLLVHTNTDKTDFQDHRQAMAGCDNDHDGKNSGCVTACDEKKIDVDRDDLIVSNQAIDTPVVPGLWSKHELNDKLDEEMVRAVRQRVPLYFAILSIDNEEMPDNALAVIGHIITNNIRAKIDTGFVSTDREFAIILPFTVKKHAVNIVKRILISLNTWDIDASIGLVSCNDIGTNDAAGVIEVAELAASEAKAEGGNRIRLLRKSSDKKTEYVPPRPSKSRHLKLLK